MHKKKIIFPTAYFCSWNGGTKLIKMCIDSILYYDKLRKFDYIILVPDKNIISNFKRIYFIIKNILKNIIKLKLKYDEWPYYNGAKELRNFFSQKKKIKIFGVDYIDEKNYLLNDANINFLSMNTNFKKKGKIGYIFDLQHKHLVDFFSLSERRDRDIFFSKILKSNDNIIVNSRDTKRNINKYFKKVKTKINVLPFCPFIDFNTKNLNKINIKKKDKYLITCNQFWKHKNYETLLHAFKFLEDRNLNLVITGQVSNKNYDYYLYVKNLIKKLNLNNVKIFINLRKEEQINLLFNSIGLIQPSLYEGGPGGFSVYEAIAMGKPILVSDIKVNKEIIYKKKLIFKKKNAKDLFKKILHLTKMKSYTKRQFLKYSLYNKKKLGKYLFNLVKNI